MITFLKGLIRANTIKPFIKKPFFIPNDKLVYNKKYNLGYLNKNKIFYVIKKNFSANGFFSNFTFVLDHLEYALKKKYIPVVDMENFQTVYNEKKRINKTFNSWEYYFSNLSKYNLSNVYKSRNVIFSSDSRIKKIQLDKDYSKKKLLNKIKINKNILLEYNNAKKKIFGSKKKILAVLVTGSLQKIVTNHELPLTPKEYVYIVKEKFKQYKCNKIFIVTEDIDYLNAFQKEFKDKLIYLKRPRSRCLAFFSHNIHFENYSRNSHRYKLGKEILIDALLLSDSPIFIYFGSNIARFSIFYSRLKQKRFQISTELNSNIRFYARWKWYLKVYFPFFFKKITYLIK
jgi:hypothetical protein